MSRCGWPWITAARMIVYHRMSEIGPSYSRMRFQLIWWAWLPLSVCTRSVKKSAAVTLESAPGCQSGTAEKELPRVCFIWEIIVAYAHDIAQQISILISSQTRSNITTWIQRIVTYQKELSPRGKDIRKVENSLEYRHEPEHQAREGYVTECM